MDQAIWGFFALIAVAIFGMVADSMWRAFLLYKATINAQEVIKQQSIEVKSHAELNTMDCQGGK